MAGQLSRQSSRHRAGVRRRRAVSVHPPGNRHHVHSRHRFENRHAVCAGPHQDSPYGRRQRILPASARARHHDRRRKVRRPQTHLRIRARQRRWRYQRTNRLRSSARKSARRAPARQQLSLSHLGILLRRGSLPRLGDGLRSAIPGAESRAQRQSRRQRSRHLAERHRPRRRRRGQHLRAHRQRHV